MVALVLCMYDTDIKLLCAVFASLVRGSEPRGCISLVSIPRLHFMSPNTAPEIHSQSSGSDRPRLGDLLCTSVLGLRRTLVSEIDKISCFISWAAPLDRYLNRPQAFRSSFWV